MLLWQTKRGCKLRAHGEMLSCGVVAKLGAGAKRYYLISNVAKEHHFVTQLSPIDVVYYSDNTEHKHTEAL